MTKSKLGQLVVRQVARLIPALGRDQRGVAAIEFAMIAPILVMLFIGAVELSQAITVDRRVTQVAHSTADLVTRTDRLCTTDAADMMQIIEQLVEPYDVAPLAVSIISVKANASNASQTTVDWAYSHNGGAAYANGQSYPLPAGLLTAGQTVVVAETTYNYSPPIFSYFLTSAFTMTEKSYLKPRGRNCVSWCNINCATGSAF